MTATISVTARAGGPSATFTANIGQIVGGLDDPPDQPGEGRHGMSQTPRDRYDKFSLLA